MPNETIDRLLTETYTGTERAAAEASGMDSAEWGKRFSLSNYLGNKLGTDPEQIFDDFDHFNEIYFGGKPLDQTLDSARSIEGLPTKAAITSPAEPFSIKETGGLQGVKGFVGETAKSLVRGTEALMSGGFAGILSAMGLNEEALMISKASNQAAETLAPTPEVSKELRRIRDEGGKFGVAKQLLDWRWYATTGAELAPNLALFGAVGAGSMGVARLAFQARWLQIPTAIAVTTTSGLLVESGSAIKQLAGDAVEAKNALEQLRSFPKEEQDRLINKGVRKSVETYETMIQAGSDPETAGRVAANDFRNNLWVQLAGNAFGLGAGRIAVTKLFKGTKKKDIATALASAGISLFKEPEEELREEENADAAILEEVFRIQVENNIWAPRTLDAILSGDKDKQDIVLASIFLGSKSVGVNLINDVSQAGSPIDAESLLAQGIERIRQNPKNADNIDLQPYLDRSDKAKTFEQKAAIWQEAARDINDKNIDLINEQLAVDVEERVVFEEDTKEAQEDVEALRGKEQEETTDPTTGETFIEGEDFKAFVPEDVDPDATQALTGQAAKDFQEGIKKEKAKAVAIENVKSRVKALGFESDRVIVHQSGEDIPANMKEKVLATPGASLSDFAGFFSKRTGLVHIITDNIPEGRTDQVIVHELAHLGLDALFGKEKLQNRLQQVFEGLTPEQLADTRKRYKLDRPIELGLPGAKELNAEEFLAAFAEDQNPDPTILQKIYAAIRQLLRDLGLFKDKVTEFTDNDIKVLLARARKAALKATKKSRQSETGKGEDLRFSKAPPTESAAFKKWFGDSKVVDENGEPLVVFHGANQDFTEFKKETIGDEFGQDKRGFFFSDSKKEAESYARNTSFGLPREVAGPVVEAFMSLQNPLIVNIDFDPVNEWDSNHLDILKKVDKGNHDGVIIKAEKFSSMYIAFEPTQIKSATENVGTFDATDPDIRFATIKESERMAKLVENADIPGIFDAAKKKFGTTKNIDEAGWILPDGTMLDFSGTDVTGRRTMNHEEVSILKGVPPDGLPFFLQIGAMRIDANFRLVELGKTPTPRQLSVIREIVDTPSQGGEVSLELFDEENDKSFDSHVTDKKVIGTIRRFFAGQEVESADLRFALKDTTEQDKQIRDVTLAIAGDLFREKNVKEESVKKALIEAKLPFIGKAAEVLNDAQVIANRVKARAREVPDRKQLIKQLESTLERRAKEGFRAGEFTERARSRVRARRAAEKAETKAERIDDKTRANLERILERNKAKIERIDEKTKSRIERILEREKARRVKQRSDFNEKLKKDKAELKTIFQAHRADTVGLQKDIMDWMVRNGVKEKQREKLGKQILDIGKIEDPLIREKHADLILARAMRLKFEAQKTVNLKKIESILKKFSEPKKTKKGQDQGPDVTAVVKAVEPVVNLSFEELTDKKESLEKQVRESEEEGDAEKTQQLREQQVIHEIFGSLKNQEPDIVERALKHLNELIVVKKAEYAKLIEERKARWDGERDLITGVLGLPSEIEFRNKRNLERSTANDITDWLNDGANKSFSMKQKLFKLADLDPTGVMDQIADTWNQFFFEAEQAETTQNRLDEDAFIENIKRIFKTKDPDKATRSLAKNRIDITLAPEEGQTGRQKIQLTHDQALNVYLSLSQPQLQQNMANNGYDARTTIELLNALPQDVIELGNWIQQVLEKEWLRINKEYKAIWGIDMPKNFNYFPFRPDRSSLNETQIELWNQGLLDLNAIHAPGATITRVQHNVALDYTEGATDVFLKHKEQMNRFVAYAVNAKDFFAVFGEKKVGRTLKFHFGEEFYKQLMRHASQTVSGGNKGFHRQATIDKLKTFFAFKVLSGNLSLFPKQISSHAAYWATLGTVDYGKAIIKSINPVGANEDYDRLINTDFIQNRWRKGQHIEAKFLLQKAKESGAKRFIYRAAKFGMIPARTGDLLPILLIGRKVYFDAFNEYKAQGKADAEADKYAQYIWGTLSEETQQSSGWKDRTHWQRESTLGVLLSMFQQSPRLYTTVGVRAIQKAVARGDAESWKSAALTTFVMFTVLPIAFKFAGDLYKFDFLGEPDDRDEEEIFFDYFTDMLKAPANGIYFSRVANDRFFEWAVSGKIPYGRSESIPLDRLPTDFINSLRAGASPFYDDIEFLEELDKVLPASKQLNQLIKNRILD